MDLRVIDPEEEELRRRMALARQQGWSEDEINRSALIERGLNQQRRARPAAQQPKTQDPDFASFLLGLLPGGSLIDKARRGEQITAGDVGMEALLTVAPFGLGKIARGVGGVVKGAKAAKDVGRISKTTGITKETVRQATQPATKAVTAAATQQTQKATLPSQVKKLIQPKEGGAVENIGSRIRGYGRGVITGVRPEGQAERLLPSDAKRINKLLDDIGAKGGVPNQLQRVEQVQQQTRGVIDQLVASKNRAIAQPELQAIANRIKANILGADGKGVPGFNQRLHGDLANQLSRQMFTAKDVVGLENFRKTLDDVINYSRNPASPDPMAERIAQMFRREIDNTVTQIVPDAKKAKGLYGALEGAKDALIVNSPMSLQQTAGTGGLFSKLFSSGATQSLLSGTGRAVQAAGRAASTPLGQQAGVRLGADALGLRQAPQDPNQLPAEITAAFENPQSADEMMINDLIASGANDFDSIARSLYGGDQGQAAPGGGAAAGGLDYSSTELFNAAMEALLAGDEASYKTLSSAAKTAADFEKSMGGGGLQLSADQQKRMTNLGNVQIQLDELGNAIEGSGLFTKDNQLAASLGGLYDQTVGAFTDQNKKIYLDQLRSRGIQIVRALGEVGNLTASEQDAAIQNLPSPGDTAEGARRKLEDLRRLFGRVQQNVLTIGGTYATPANSTLPDDFSQILNGSYAY